MKVNELLVDRIVARAVAGNMKDAVDHFNTETSTRRSAAVAVAVFERLARHHPPAASDFYFYLTNWDATDAALPQHGG